MNLFSFVGDLLHLTSIVIILLKIYTQKTCRGISLKTQFLYALVFCCRYLDLFYNFSSWYNWVMKIVFIGSSVAIVYLMTKQPAINATYDRKADSFNIYYLLVPCGVLALCINEVFWSDAKHAAHHHSIFFYITEILWTFSIYLEAVAIVPQLVMVHAVARQQGGFVEALTADYVFTLGGYRAMYLLNWIYRWLTETHYRNWIVWIAGVVQTGIYCDFFYYYLQARMSGQKMSLPI